MRPGRSASATSYLTFLTAATGAAEPAPRKFEGRLRHRRGSTGIASVAGQSLVGGAPPSHSAALRSCIPTKGNGPAHLSGPSHWPTGIHQPTPASLHVQPQ